MKSLYSTRAAARRMAIVFVCAFQLSTSLSALDYYWVNGSGDWSDFANHWAKIPNPTLPAHYHANVPTADDDVFFGDTNGGAAYTVNVDAGSTVPKCRNMDWTGVPAGTVWGGGGGPIDIYGSTTLDPNMSITFTGQVQMQGIATMHDIDCNGVHFPKNVVFTGSGGGWNLVDDFYADENVYHQGGLIETNGLKVTIASSFFGNYPTGTGQLHLGSSEFIIGNGGGWFRYTPAQFDAGTSHIKFIGNDCAIVGATYFNLLALHFYDISFFGNFGQLYGGFNADHVDGTLTFQQDATIISYNGFVPILNNVVLLGDGYIVNAQSYNHLTLTAGKTYTIAQYQGAPSTDQTILPGGSLTALGAGTCSQFITIKSGQYGTHFNFVNNSGAQQTVHCAILEDCHATGSDPLEVIDGVNLGNNPGWIFTAPNPGLDLYWIGGAGDWNDPNHWSETDGGSAGICIPNGGSNVHFTALSGFSPGDQVTVSVDAYCKNMDWTGVTGEPTFLLPSGTYLHLYGSLTLATPAEMTFQNDNDMRLRGSTVHTITTAGQVLHRNAIFEGSGLYKFADAFNSLAYIIHLRGQIKTMGYPVNILGWYGNFDPYAATTGDYSAEAWLGDPDLNISSTITLQDNTTYPANISEFRNEYAAGKFHAMQSEIISTSGGIDAVRTLHSPAIHDYWRVTFPTDGTFQRGNVLDRLYFGLNAQLNQGGDFHEVFFNSTANILGSHRYDILSIQGTHGYNIEGGTVQTITTGGALHVLGATCQGMAYLLTQYPTQTAKIAMESGPLNLDRVILDNIYPDLSTGATYSATNSVAIQPQVAADWNLTNPPARDLYWVGGGGDWQDSNHWSLASGGAPGECPPTPLDDVFFDAASGLVAGEAVTPTQFWQFCKDMDWTGVNGGKLLYAPTPYTPNNIQVFGSLTFSPGMVNEFYGPFWLRAGGPATITSNGVHFRNELFFWEPLGDWSLNDGLDIDLGLRHHYGKFTTNSHPISLGFGWSGGATGQEAFLGNSTIRLLGTVNNGFSIYYSIAALYYNPGTFHPGTSHFIFESPTLSHLYGNGYNPELYDVTFKANSNTQLWGAKISHKLIAEGDLYIDYANGDNYIHDAEFRGDTWLSDSRPYHSIKFFPGKRYTFGGGYNPFGGPYTTTLVPHNGVEGQFIAQGLPGQYIEMKSSDPNSPAIIHKDDYDGTSTCTKYLFLTGMTHTGTEDIYVPTPGGDVFNNSGWLFFPCNPCPATIPVLDSAASIITGCPPGKAKLVLAGLKPDEWANWYTDPAATTDLVYSGGTPGPAGNMFQPAITGPITYYARVYSDGGLCESTVVLAVDITITNPPAVFNVTGGGLVCSGSNGTPVGLDGSATGVSYQLQLDGSDVGGPLAGTGAALDFGLQTAAGTYTVVATTDGTACSAVMSGSAVVTGSPNQAPVVVASSNGPLCAGPADLLLFESGGAAASWTWSGPGGFGSSDQNPVIPNPSPVHSGLYTVVVSDGLGCTNIAQIVVAVAATSPSATCPSGQAVCLETPPFALNGATPIGGDYSGAGVSQGMFDPAAAGVGQHTITYTMDDGPNCASTCTFHISVADEALPVAVCDEFTAVALGTGCMALVDAKTFDDGSFDYCLDVFFKVRRLTGTGCEPDDRFYDQMKFCAADLGQTISIVLRVYDVPVPSGGVDATFEQSNANDCVVEVEVQDKTKPTCVAPANITVSCANFDPTLAVYGFATGADNCCFDTITVTDNRTLFDSLCNRGTIVRTFRAFDCGGLSTTCTFRIVFTHDQNFYIKFPDDVLATNCDPNGNYGEPEFFGVDCELVAAGYDDQVVPVVPDACFKIERTWTIINWCTYNPNLGCTVVPNPRPLANPNHPANLPGPTVSEAGAAPPWAPTEVAILPGQPLTNYSSFWSANANCYQYTQSIKIIDSAGPVLSDCPAQPLPVCDPSANDPEFWNEPYWLDPTTNGNDLPEGATDLAITATDLCSGADVQIRYVLFLDLDHDGTQETAVHSANLPGFNTVYFGNASNPNYSGGAPRAFDERPVPADEKYGFALQTTVSGNNKTAAVRWNTQQAPNTYTLPELPRGTHKIKWFVEDACGNESICENVFTIKSDCNAPTVVCNSCVNAELPQSQSVTIGVADVLQHTEDDVTPQNLLITAIRKAGTGSGFPGAPPNSPQTSIEFGCGELGLQQVEVWSLDEAGNSAFCLASVLVGDPLGVCGGQPSYPNLTFCPGENTPAIPLSGPVQGATYSWLNDNPGIGLEVLGLGDIPSFIAANNTAAPLTAVVQVYTHFGACPSPDPVSFTITVNPAPVVFAPDDVMVCQSENTAPIQFSGSLPGMTFSWTNDNPAIGLAAVGTGDIPSFTAENNTSSPLTAHIEVIGGGIPGLQCPDPIPAYFTIVVKPTPMVTDPGNQVVCAGAQSAPVQFSGTLPGTTFSWTNDNPAIGLAATGTGDIASFMAVNNTGAPVTATITVTPMVGDQQPPTVTCVNGLVANLMPPGMMTLFATDFLSSAQDNVTPFDQLKIAIRKTGSGSGFPLDTYGNPQASVCFDCSEIGLQTVEIWVEDACGNADFCQATVTILDGNGVCNNGSGSGFCISGKAVTEYGDGVAEVHVSVTGPGVSQTVLTDDGGNYMLCDLPGGQNYEVCMVKDVNPLNGVSSYDLVLMSKHILGIELLDSPYKIIAADVNLSETVTVFDLEETRKLILGIYTEFPLATSWQFVPADHVFPNPANPFADPFPRGCKTVSLNGDVHNQDFIAIKTADLNGGAVANDRPAASKPTNTMQMQVACADCPGEPVAFTITVQPTLAFDVVPVSPSCNGATDGSLAVGGVSGGQAPYQYALNNNPLQNSPLFSGLGVGTYTITVQDADGCTAQQQANLPQGPDQPLAIQCPSGLPPLTANSSCQATLGDYTGLATLSGGCNIPLNPTVQAPAPGTIVNPGTVAVALTVSNTAGQCATCVFNVAVSGGCGH